MGSVGHGAHGNGTMEEEDDDGVDDDEEVVRVFRPSRALSSSQQQQQHRRRRDSFTRRQEGEPESGGSNKPSFCKWCKITMVRVRGGLLVVFRSIFNFAFTHISWVICVYIIPSSPCILGSH